MSDGELASDATEGSGNGGDRAPLDGLRVLDFTRVVAGPYCTRMLADLGADVVKVDGPGSPGARASGSVTNNLGKRSIVLDLKHPAGLEVARALASRCDVLVENFTPGVMDRLGLGYDDLASDHPRLVYASIRGFAGEGPDGARRAFGATAHAEAGWLWVQQQAQGGEHPFAPGVTVADIITAVGAFSSIMTALYERERSGRGQRVEAALMDWQLAMLSEVFATALNGSPGVWEPFRHPIHRTRDGGYVTINIGGQRNWDRIARALGHPGETMPPDVEAANRTVGGWVQALPGGEVTRRMHEEGAPYGLLSDLQEAAAHPYVREQGLIVSVPDPVDGSLRALASPILLSRRRRRPLTAAPMAGEQTAEILSELGYTTEELEDLIASAAAQQAASS
jgi:CoA:oxalate CoA-transferase